MLDQSETFDEKLAAEATPAAGVLGAWRWSGNDDCFVFDRGAASVLLGDGSLSGVPIGRSSRQLRFHPDDFDVAMDSFAVVASSRGSIRLEFRVQGPGSHIRWLLCKGSVEQRDDGSLSATGLFIDTTDDQRPGVGNASVAAEHEAPTAAERVADLCVELRHAVEKVGDRALLAIAELALHRMGSVLARDSITAVSPKPMADTHH